MKITQVKITTTTTTTSKVSGTKPQTQSQVKSKAPSQPKQKTFQSLNPFLLRSLLNPSKIPYLNPTTTPYTVQNQKSKTIK